MYLYYDKNGLLQEIVNPDSPHRTSVDFDKIYIYVDGYVTTTNGFALFKASDGTLSNELPITKGQPQEIPYNSKRDLKFFKYFEDYSFFEITVPQEILQVSGLVTLNFRLVLGEFFKQLDLFPFTVKDGIQIDTCITQSQYNLLLNLIANKTDQSDFKNSAIELTTTEYNIVRYLEESVIYKGYYNGKSCVFRVEKEATKVKVHAILTSRTNENENGIYGYELIFENGIATIENQKTLVNVLDYTTGGDIKNILADLSNKIYANELTINQSWLVQTGQRTHVLIFATLFNGKHIEYTLVKNDTIQKAVVNWVDAKATADNVLLEPDLKTFLQEQITENKDKIEANTQNIVLNKNDIVAIQNDYISKTEKGQPNGLATLDKDGFISSGQLPSHIDDIIDGTYVNETTFNDANGVPVIPNTSTIYYDTTTFKRYGWSGTAFVNIGGDVTFGEVKGTAYEGDKGKANADAIALLQLDKLDKKPIYLEHGTDLYTYNWNAYENGTYFAGTNFVNLPSEIVDHKDVVIQLIKQNESGRFALVLYHTGIYENNTGVYINFHYSDKFKGWENLLGVDEAKINEIINAKGFQNETQVNDLINAKGYKTESEINTLIDNKQLIPLSQKGAKNGVASLDGNGKIPANQLPESVDEITEGEINSSETVFTATDGTIYSATQNQNLLSGRLFVSVSKNITYRWSGTKFTAIGSSLSLGETSETAYAGDKGKQNATNIADLQTDVNHIITVDIVNLDQDKVDKIKQQYQLYATDRNSNQIALQYNVDPLGSDIPERTGEGRVKGTTALEDDDLVNKAQFDSGLKTKQNKLSQVDLDNIAMINQYANNIMTNTSDITNLKTNKQDKLTAGTGITIVDNVISSTGGGGIEVVETLPTATDEEYNEHKLYFNDNALHYLGKSAGDTLTSQPVGITSGYTIDYGVIVANGNIIYSIGSEVQTIDILNKTADYGKKMTGATQRCLPLVYNGKVYIFGGVNSSGSDVRKEVYILGEYKISISGTPQGLWDSVGVVYGDDAYIFGGSNPSTFDIKTAYKYNFLSRSFTPIAILPDSSPYCCALIDKNIYIIIGMSIYKYSIDDNNYTKVATIPNGLGSLSNIELYTIGSNIYLFGFAGNQALKFNSSDNSIVKIQNTPIKVEKGRSVQEGNYFYVLDTPKYDVTKLSFDMVNKYFKITATEE